MTKKKAHHIKPTAFGSEGEVKKQRGVVRPGEYVKREVHTVKSAKSGSGEEYALVTRRGYVVPLRKGKEGIHDKFDEVLNNSCDL